AAALEDLPPGGRGERLAGGDHAVPRGDHGSSGDGLACGSGVRGRCGGEDEDLGQHAGLLPPRLTAGYRAPMVGPRSVEERTMEAKARLHCWESMPKERLSEKLDRRIITGDRMMITHVYLKKGCLVPRHQHENEQITYVL